MNKMSVESNKLDVWCIIIGKYPMIFGTVASGVLRKFSTAQSIVKVALPELKYNYSALEPVLSSKLLEIHHKKHHQAYVNNLNAAIEQFEGRTPNI